MPWAANVSGMTSVFLLEIDGISGDSTREGHEGAIELLSWSWGVSRDAGRPGGGIGAGGRPDFDEVQVVAQLSSASPELIESCVTAQRHGAATLSVLRAGETDVELVRYELGDVQITNVEHSDADEGTPVEELALSYRAFTITFTTQDEDGSAGRQTTFAHP